MPGVPGRGTVRMKTRNQKVVADTYPELAAALREQVGQ